MQALIISKFNNNKATRSEYKSIFLYRVPGISSEVMSEGIEKILSKNEELLASCSDTSVQRNIKYVSERLRKFAKPVNIASNDNPINEAKETSLGNGIPEKIDVPEDVACISKSSINEAEPKSNEIDEDLKEIEFPEVQKQIHQVLEDDSLERRKSTDSFAFTGSNLKKLRYDSPLDILKSNSKYENIENKNLLSNLFAHNDNCTGEQIFL